MKTRKKRPESESVSNAMLKGVADKQEEVRTNMYATPTEWSYWGNKKEDEKKVTDYGGDAIKAANSITTTLDEAWTKGNNNTADAIEYGGLVVKRGDAYTSANQKSGQEGKIKLKYKGGDLQDKDEIKGEYHSHQYSTDDIAKVTGAYDWDGSGTGPSGQDFCALAYQKLSDGYFSIVEAGTVRSIIVVNNAEKYKAAFVKRNDAGVIDMTKTIDGEIEKAILTEDYMPKNPKATNKKTYVEAYWLGLINGLNEVKKQNDNQDIGLTLLKSKPGKKTEYDTVYP